MKWVRNWWMMLSSYVSKRRRAQLTRQMATLRANNVQYRRACEAAIKGIRNADSMLSGVTTNNPNVRAAQSQLRFSLNATCEFIARVQGEGDV